MNDFDAEAARQTFIKEASQHGAEFLTVRRSTLLQLCLALRVPAELLTPADSNDAGPDVPKPPRPQSSRRKPQTDATV